MTKHFRRHWRRARARITAHLWQLRLGFDRAAQQQVVRLEGREEVGDKRSRVGGGQARRRLRRILAEGTHVVPQACVPTHT